MIMELLGRELTRARRENKCTAILLGDLDHFKNINNTFGHLAGDEVLRETARRLVSSVRSYDFVGRFGGEEFLVYAEQIAIQHSVWHEPRRFVKPSPRAQWKLRQVPYQFP